MKYAIATFVAFILPVLIGLGLYAIKDQHYGVTNVCNEQFYPDLCGKKTDKES